MEKVAATLLFCKFISCMIYGSSSTVNLCVHTVLYLTSAQQERCGIIGNSDETAATPSRLQFFYLNAAYPAPCTGNITSWRVCYHGPDTLDISGSYWATYAVYQRNSGNSVRYVRVSEMFRAIRTVTNFISVEEADGEIAQGGFNCYNDSINSPLTIQAGDILGVCVFTPDNSFGINRFPLDVIGEASGESLLQMTGTSDCSREDIPSDIDISANQFLTLNSRRLHIYANIGKLCESHSNHVLVSISITQHIMHLFVLIEVEPATIPSISIAAATTTIRVTGIEFQTITGSTLATTESVSACSMETTADIVYDTEGTRLKSKLMHTDEGTKGTITTMCT